MSSYDSRLKSKRLFSKIFLNSALSEMLKILIYIICDNFLTVRDKKNAKNNKFLKKCEGTVLKISAPLEHFSVLVLEGLKIRLSKFWLLYPIFRHNADPDPGPN